MGVEKVRDRNELLAAIFREWENLCKGRKEPGMDPVQYCAVLHSIEHTVNETVLRNQCCLLHAEEVDPCGLFQDIRTS